MNPSAFAENLRDDLATIDAPALNYNGDAVGLLVRSERMEFTKLCAAFAACNGSVPGADMRMAGSHLGTGLAACASLLSGEDAQLREAAVRGETFIQTLCSLSGNADKNNKFIRRIA